MADQVSITRLDNPANHNSENAPIRRLSPEILELIFNQAVQQNTKIAERGESGYSWLAPLNISAVCWQWRSICLSYPKLWSFITVVTGFHDDSERYQYCVDDVCLDHIDRFQTFLERSGNCPLTVCIQHPFDYDDQDYQDDDRDDESDEEVVAKPSARELLPELIHHRDRFRHLIIYGRHNNAIKVPAPEGAGFPILESLTLDPLYNFYPEEQMEPPWSGQLDWLGKCHALSDVQVMSGFENIQTTPLFPFCQITTLEISIRTWNISGLQKVLPRLSSNLVQLVIVLSIGCDDGEKIPKTRPIPLPALKSFHFKCTEECFVHGREIVACLSLVQACNLQKLLIMVGFDDFVGVPDEIFDESLPVKKLAKFIEAFYHSLEELTLDWVFFYDQTRQQVVEMFTDIPVLQHLHLSCSSEIYEFLSHEPVLPKLRSFTLSLTYPKLSDFRDAAKVVNAHLSAPNSPFDLFVFRFNGFSPCESRVKLEETDRQTIESWRARGVRFRSDCIE